MERQLPEYNQVRVSGWLSNLRQRWTPDGSLAVVAELSVARPQLGPARASVEERQPLPIRASGMVAEQLSRAEQQYVVITGMLRRRFYRRNEEPQWGQVEIWARTCETKPAQPNEHEEMKHE
ncbi:MAG: hypothetical protein D6678_06970 [Zetaproteobacteria bacterium]|nr:MAG: hypothetical protein D6678_06970 [Zetaproteobacteria bacterium]